MKVKISSVRKPKPLYGRTSHHYIDAHGKRWITTAKPGSPLQPGCRWEKERHYGFEVFINDDGKPYSIHDVSVEDLTPARAEEIAKWWRDVARWIRARNRK